MTKIMYKRPDGPRWHYVITLDELDEDCDGPYTQQEAHWEAQAASVSHERMFIVARMRGPGFNDPQWQKEAYYCEGHEFTPVLPKVGGRSDGGDGRDAIHIGHPGLPEPAPHPALINQREDSVPC